MTDRIAVPLDPIGITSAEFEEVRALTKRFSGDVKAIFSVNRDGDKWAPPGHGNTPSSKRELLMDTPYVLGQLAKSLGRRKIEGGRMFVTRDGAFWKSGTVGNIERIQFVSWRWEGEPPERGDIPELTWEDIQPMLRKPPAEKA